MPSRGAARERRGGRRTLVYPFTWRRLSGSMERPAVGDYGLGRRAVGPPRRDRAVPPLRHRRLDGVRIQRGEARERPPGLILLRLLDLEALQLVVPPAAASSPYDARMPPVQVRFGRDLG